MRRSDVAEATMSPDSVEAGARIVLLAIPHPASRRIAAFLQAVLAAGEQGIACALAASPDIGRSPGETLVYLRPGAADAVELAVMADLTARPDVRSAHARVAELDHRWRDIDALRMEQVIADPHAALRRLCALAGQPLDGRVFEAAEALVAALRQDLEAYGHPLAFLAAVDRCGDTEARGALEPPPAVLVLTGPASATLVRPAPDADEGPATSMSVEDASSPRLEALGGPQGRIHLHHVTGAPGLSELLDRILPRLAPLGRLSGEEGAAAAAQAVVSQLTLRCNHRGLVFILSGASWQAVPRSWWR
jgi:hypothetical protein